MQEQIIKKEEIDVFVILCLIIGIVCALYLPYTFSLQASKFVAIAILAGIDSVFGGLAATVNNNFKMKIFLLIILETEIYLYYLIAELEDI